MGTGTLDPASQTSRALIHQVAESHGSHYQLWAELVPCEHPADHVELKFSSIWTGARNPDDGQVRARFLLSPDALSTLQQLIGSR